MTLPYPDEAQQLATGGLLYPLREMPPLSRAPPPHLVSAASPEMLATIQPLLDRGLLFELDSAAATEPACWASAFTVPKANGKHRLIVNPRALNEHILPCSFALPQLPTIAAAAASAAALAVTDAEDAFHHLRVHPSHRRLVRFAFRAPCGSLRCFELHGVGMGVSASARLCQRVIANAIVAARLPPGTIVAQFLDDVTTIFDSPMSLRQAADTLQHMRLTFESLGLPVNWKKSSPVPTRLATVLGFQLDLDRRMRYLPTDKIRSARQAVARLMASQRPTAFLRAQALGTLTSLHGGYRWSRLNTSSIIARLRTQLASAGWEGKGPGMAIATGWRRASYRHMYNHVAPLNESEKAALAEWKARLTRLLTDESAVYSLGNAWPLAPPLPSPRSLVLSTDSSSTGWGSELIFESSPQPPPLAAAAVTSWHTIRQHLLPAACPPTPAAVAAASRCSGVWSAQQRSSHITSLEMSAAALAVEHLAQTLDLRGAHILLLVDASAAVATINRNGSARVALDQALLPLARLQMRLNCHVTSARISSAENVWADRLSRHMLAEETAVEDPRALQPATTARAAPSLASLASAVCRVDLFASADSTLMPSFVSLSGAPPAMASDAMTQDWGRLARLGPLWIFPPPPLLPRVVALLRQLPHLQFLLVTPHWPLRPWYQALLAMRHLRVYALPSDAIASATGGTLPYPQTWTLWAPSSISAALLQHSRTASSGVEPKTTLSSLLLFGST